MSESFFFCTSAGGFLYRFLCFPNDYEICFIKYDTSGVQRYGPYFKNPLVALISGFNLFRERFLSN